jgi:hypothetical protein
VIPASDLPASFAAVLAGHIHRHQVLTTDPRGRRLPAPVLYPGSIERTAFAELGEDKGYLTLEMGPGRAGGVLRQWTFHRLPARPMVIHTIRVESADGPTVRRLLGDVIGRAAPDAVLRIRVLGVPRPEGFGALAAPSVRALAPPTMNVDIVVEAWRQRAPRTPSAPTVPEPLSQAGRP